jgi:hypothetical protein
MKWRRVWKLKKAKPPEEVKINANQIRSRRKRPWKDSDDIEGNALGCVGRSRVPLADFNRSSVVVAFRCR